jgi:hypothetical protein
MAYEQLDADKIVETAERLHRRIVERFPQSGLAGVCQKLLEIAQAARERSAEIARPIMRIRVLSGLVIALILASAAWTAWMVFSTASDDETASTTELIQGVEAGINDLLLIGATVFFLVTWETRVKRGRALRAIHELRSIAHVIDMHQLTKDPERLFAQWQDTRSSPARAMTQFELSRYLDYCSEMLSITGKIAALYVQGFEDSVAVSAVNDIEDLTTSLARKVWQKLMVLHAVDDQQGRRAQSAPSPVPAPQLSPDNEHEARPDHL